MFVLTKTTIDVDCGVIDTEIIIASNDFQKVSNKMKEEIKLARKHFNYCEHEQDKYCSGDMCYSIWEKHWEMAQRIDLRIQEVELQ